MTASRQAQSRVAVIGAGWAGLASAIELVQHGAAVTLYEMARDPGGRARCSKAGDRRLDNGQHIMVGAYVDTLGLMRRIGVDVTRLTLRVPLTLCGPDGRGLRLKPGHPVPAFVRAVLGHAGWQWNERAALLRTAMSWAIHGFRCSDQTSVAQLCQGLPPSVRRDLVDPLCIAALNTRAELASAQVFLRVLRDALFGSSGGADLVLPRVGLDELLPAPALKWLASHGAVLRLGHRVMELAGADPGWFVDGGRYDQVVLACSAREAARLTGSVAPAWSASASAFTYEPIVTVYLSDPNLHLVHPMVALPDDGQAPAQFAFDLGALGVAPGLFSFVVSGARPWVERGLRQTAQAVLAQARCAFSGSFSGPDESVLAHVRAEQRATFVCAPGLLRPSWRPAPGLLAAGDYVEGPYPATLEGAVRSGLRAARQALSVGPFPPA